MSALLVVLSEVVNELAVGTTAVRVSVFILP